MQKKEYTIGEVLDNDTGLRSEKWSYRIGRRCTITLLQIDESMIIEYIGNNGVFRTSKVLEIEQTDYGFWVKTINRTYRLDEDCFYNN